MIAIARGDVGWNESAMRSSRDSLIIRKDAASRFKDKPNKAGRGDNIGDAQKYDQE